MRIRTASKEELNSLWKNNSPTKTYFMKGIENGNIEFWTVEDQDKNKLIGELYIIWDSPDKDEANGVDRAYLCAFRIEKDYQGRGLGKKLMMRVIERIREKGFKEATIGADNDNADKLTAMYKSWGFEHLVKYTNTDYHYLDENNNPVSYDEAWGVYLKKI